MSGFTSLMTAVSGMRAAQLGLSITGHNMANSEIAGYSRQRSIQQDYFYQPLRETPYGVQKRGLGTDNGVIHQIRNEFLDLTYRTQSGKLNFYAVKSLAGIEIETLLGEMQGSYKFQDIVNDMWKAMQELTAHPDGIETRDFFRATCESFIVKANEVYDSLFTYQHNLDQQVRDAVKEINSLVGRVKELNVIISAGEASGDHANDYRDERNLCLDKLSALIPIDYYEDRHGMISVFSDGHQLLSQYSQNLMGLKYCNPNSSLVIPVFTTSKSILPADTPPSDFEEYINFNKPINSYRNNDFGSLKALILARGTGPAFYMGADGLVEPRKWDNPPEDPANFDSARFAAAVNAAGGKLNDPAFVKVVNDYFYYFPAFKEGVNNGTYDLTNPGAFTEFENASAAAGVQIDKIAERLYRYAQDNFKAIYPGYDPADPAAFVHGPEDERRYEAYLYNHKANLWSIRYGMIPNTMTALDAIVHSTVTMINDMMAPYLKDVYARDPDAPYNLHGLQEYDEVFVRNNMSRWDGNSFNGEVPGDHSTYYSIGNMSINVKLKDQPGGFNFLAFSSNGDRGNADRLIEMLTHWSDPQSEYAIHINGLTYRIQDAYQKFVTLLAIEFQEANNYVQHQTTQVQQAENKRQSIMGVSLDEEMNFMMKYQYAYNAAARILNVIDGMLDKIINGMLR